MSYTDSYNTQDVHIRLKEYGKNVQMLANYVAEIEDEEKKLKLSQTLVHLMKQLNPSLRDNVDLTARLWNHLYYISDFQLKLEDAPYPQPEEDMISRQPQRVDYGQNTPNYKHYGKNVEILIEHAINEEDPKQKEAAIIHIGKLMKRFYMTWNKDNVDDGVIIKNIGQLSKNQLTIDEDLVKEHDLFKVSIKETGNGNSGGHSFKKKNNNNNNNRKRKPKKHHS